MIQRTLAIWSLIPLPFLNPACTSGISQSTYYWSLAWRILSIPLLPYEMSTIVRQFEHSLGLEWKLTFSSPVATAVFQICWHIECSTFTALSFRIWNSSAGIPPPPLALSVVMLPKAHLTSHSRMSGSRWVITSSWLSGLRPFLYSSSVYSCHLFLISSASVKSIPFLLVRIWCSYCCGLGSIPGQGSLSSWVPKNSKERWESLLKWIMQRNRRKQQNGKD